MDLLHIDGKPYVLVPMQEYRKLTNRVDEDAAADAALPDDVLNALAARTDHPVKVLRRFRKMTQVDLAKLADMSRAYLTEIETGRKQGSIRAMRQLADALKVNPGLLLAQ